MVFRLLIFFLFSTVLFSFAKPVKPVDAPFSKTVKYLNEITFFSAHWIKTPGKTKQKEELVRLIDNFDNVKEMFLKECVEYSYKEEKLALESIIPKYLGDRDKLMHELLSWKYTPGKLSVPDILLELSNVVNTAKGIMEMLKDEESYRTMSGLSVMECQVSFESELKPSADILIKKLREISQ